MSGSLPVQYSKIQIRRGPSADLPGMPTGGGSLPTPGLDIGEFGYTNDLGRLFIGIDPTSGLPQLTRDTFPYNNIEVLTENSNDFLQTNFDARVQDMQSGYFAADTFVYAPYTPINVTINSIPLEINLPVNNVGQAVVYYFLYDPNSNPPGNPVKTGILKITYTNSSLEPSVTDCGNTYQNYTGLTIGSDPNVAFGAIQFIASVVNGNVVLQYLNSTNITPYMYFRIERASSGEDYGNEGGGGGGGGSTSEVTFSGDVTGSIAFGPPDINSTLTLSTLGTAGTYAYSVTTDSKGRVVSGNNYVPLSQAGSINLTPAQLFSRNWHVDNFGAYGNAVTYTGNFSITSGQSVLTSTQSIFNSSMVGMQIALPAAGPSTTWPPNGTFSGATVPGYLVATITGYVSSTQVNLSIAAQATLSNQFLPVVIGNDDTAAFNNGLTALGNAGGGTLFISPRKRYFIGGQIALATNTGIDCDQQPFESGNDSWSSKMGALVLVPGSPWNNTTNGNPGTGNAWNPAFSNGGVYANNQGGFLRNLYLMSAGVWSIQSAIDAENLGFGTQYGLPVGGTGVNMSARQSTVENCYVLGFAYGVVSTPSKLVTATGVWVGGSGSLPVIKDVHFDCATGLTMGSNGTECVVERVENIGYLNPANVNGRNTNWQYPTSGGATAGQPVSDGAGGTILSLTGSGVSLGTGGNTQSPPQWTAGTNTIIGSPIAGQTVTVSIYDVNNAPLYSVGSSMVGNRVTGILQPSTTNTSGGGFDLHLPNCPNNWAIWGVYTDSNGNQQLGQTGVTSTPVSAAFTAVSTRSGPFVYLNQAGFMHLRYPHGTAGNGILCYDSPCTIVEPTFDGNAKDVSTPTSGFMLYASGNSGNIKVITGEATNVYGAIYNASTGSFGFHVTGFSTTGPTIAFYQNGLNMVCNNCFFGNNGALVNGPNSEGLIIADNMFATSTNGGGNTPTTVLQSASAPRIRWGNYIGTPNGSGAPTGSWMPTFQIPESVDFYVAYSVQTGYYSVVGNLCYVWFQLEFSPTYTPTVSLVAQIGGLPFISGAVSSTLNVQSTSGFSWSTSTQLQLMVIPTGTVMDIYGLNSNGSGSSLLVFSTMDFPSGGTYSITGSGTYTLV